MRGREGGEDSKRDRGGKIQVFVKMGKERDKKHTCITRSNRVREVNIRET